MFTTLHIMYYKLGPKSYLTRLIGWLASKNFSKVAIRWFAKRYKINLDEAAEPIESFNTLNEFFTRKLKDGVRPIAEENNFF